MRTIFNTASVVMKSFVRSRRACIMRLLFPVVLILVLSMALSKSFDSQSFNLAGETVAYTQDGGAASVVLAQFEKTSEEQLGLKFVSVSDATEAIDGIKNNRYDAYISAQDSKLTYYKNSNPAYSFTAEVLQPSLQTFAMRAGALFAIASANPGGQSAAAAEAIGSYAKTVSLDMKPQSAIDYYSVVILLMITLYGSATGMNAVKSGRVYKIDQRLYASPVSQYQVFIGRILGSMLVNLLAAILLIGISALLGANWGGNMGLTIAIIVSVVVFSQAFGVALGMLVKNNSTVNVVMNFVIPVIAFFGGCFFPIQNFSGLILQLSYLSPIKWAAQAIFDSISSVPGNSALYAIAINLGLAALLIAASTFRLNRERELK